jgi:phage gp46-like protein
MNIDLQYDGDPALLFGPDGCTLVYEAGQPRMDAGGLENAVLISLFSQKGWPGNDLDRNQPERHIGSDFEEKIIERPITTNTLLKVEQAGSRALAWLVDEGIAKSATVRATAPGRNRIDVVVSVIKPDGAEQPFRYSLNWEAGVMSGPVNMGM